MSILYFSIIDKEKDSILGSYIPLEINNSSLKDSIESKIRELMTKIKIENGLEKNIINFQTLPDKKIDIFYILTNKNILYIAFVEVLFIYIDNFKDEAIFELVEEIDSQGGIKKHLDKNGKLSKVGEQNLKFSIEKYQNTFFSKNDVGNSSLIEEPKNNKIQVINEQIKSVQNDMKNNVKNMMGNINDINEIENKSVVIKDSSFKFRSDSLALEKKMKRKAWKNRIILIAIVVIVLALFIYFMSR